MKIDYWISELGRIFERSTEAIENEYQDATEPLAEDFNRVLLKLQDEFKDNEIIIDTKQVEGRTEGGSVNTPEFSTYIPSKRRDEALHEIRSGCERIANALDYELPERKNGNDTTNRMVMVSVDSNQNVQQEVNQQVTIESIMELIQLDPQAAAYQDELQEITEQFDDELESDDPDPGRLRQFIDDAKGYSTSVAAKLAMLGLQAGAIDILGL
ncbi:hypothetical protein [Haladaptatus caseinilyticus]|uniref:hypothetical protein n=1 Tax=Haladaptatus caseinilyticus TaxID=2993314 RepID=UPI00224ABFE6|nr:hypothetical protein [Haladaptatus caseinilyticus]